MGRRLGLIIGVNNYQDTAFQPLRYAETDAKALAQWLVNARGGKWNPADVQVTLGTEVTRELTENLISVCLNMAASEDFALLYFAGYAFIDPSTGDGYLACYNTHHQQPASGLHLRTLVNQLMARSAAAQILCILDCFQSGPVWNMRRTSPFDYKPLIGPGLQNSLQQMQGRLLYCTCRGNNMAPEVGERNLGSFMYRMIMGVGGPAIDPMAQQITFQRLHEFLSAHLKHQHQPQVFGQEQRPIVLVGDLPSFQHASSSHNNGDLPPLYAGAGPLARQTMSASASAIAQISPSSSDIERVPMSPLEQNRQQQCQQMTNQAQQLVQMQQLSQAYQLLETVLQIAPSFVDALILKSQILGSQGQFQEALNTVKKVVEAEPQNALGWSMAAALLANTGQLPEAMSAVDRSLSIDPSNSETISIKAMIREKLAELQVDTGKRSRLLPPLEKPGDDPKSFALGSTFQLLGLILGLAGAFTLLLQPRLPIIIGLSLESIGLGLLCVNSWRGSYLYGAGRFLLTLLFSLISLGTLGALYFVKPAYNFLLHRVENSYALLTPLVFLIIWLAAAALLPALAGLSGWISGAIARSRRKRN